MSLRTRFAAFFARTPVAPVEKSGGGQIVAQWTSDSPGGFFTSILNAMEESDLTNPVKQHPWVYACLRVITENFASVPFRLYRGTEGKGEEDEKARRLQPQMRLDAIRRALPPTKPEPKEPKPSEDEKPTDLEKSQEVIEQGPVYDLFAKPNPLMVRSQLWKATIHHLTRKGLCAWLKLGKGKDGYVESESEVPTELWPMDGSLLTPRIDQKTQLPVAWDGQRANATFTLRPHQIIWFRYTDPDDPHLLKGLAPLEALGVSAQGDWRAMMFNSLFFKNGASIGGWIQAGLVNAKQAKELQEIWEDRYAGWQKAHKTAILVGKDSTYTQSTQNHHLMEFSELRKTAFDEITGVLGVPPTMLGITEDVNRASSMVTKAILFENTLIPIMSYIEDVLEVELVKWNGPEQWGEFDLATVEALRENIAEKVVAAGGLFAMGVPIGQINKKLELGLQPMEHDDISFLPMGLSKLEDVLDPPLTPGYDEFGVPLAPAEPGEPDEDEDKPGKKPPADENPAPGKPPPTTQSGPGGPKSFLIASPSALPAPSSVETSPTGVPAADVVRALERAARDKRSLDYIRTVQTPAERYALTRIKGYFSRARVELIGLLHEVIESKAGTVRGGADGPASKAYDPKALITLTEGDVERITLAKQKWDAELRRVMGTIWEFTSKAAMERLRLELGGFVHFNAANPAVLQAMALKRIKVVRINDTIRTRLRETLMKSIEELKTTTQTAEEIFRSVGDGLKREMNSVASRSLTIARTETAQVASKVRYEAFKAEGVLTHQWVSSADEHVRPSHVLCDGVVVAVGQPFPNGLLYPSDMAGSAAEVVNCRCVLTIGEKT